MNAASPALVAHLEDDVASLLAPVGAWSRVQVRTLDGEALEELLSRGPVPFGHKIARRHLAAGAPVRKYGRVIGAARDVIEVGEMVGVHNLAPPSKGRAREPEVLVPSGDLSRLAKRLGMAAGASEAAADSLAEALVEAHLRGVETHGLSRLRPYLERIRAGSVDGRAEPSISRRGAVLVVDAHNAPGPHAARCAVRALALAASEHGVAVALVRHSNHFGFAGHWATMLAGRSRVGLVTSNGQPWITAPGGRHKVLSNSPLAIAAPLPGGDYFELDIATSVGSGGAIRDAARAGCPIPEGWAVDSAGRPTVDPVAALEGALKALGGTKGYGLILALEVLNGALAGGAMADQVGSKDAGSVENVSHFMLAIDVQHTSGLAEFGLRLSDLVARCAEPDSGRYPGRRRWRLRSERLSAGIPLGRGLADDLQLQAQQMGLDQGGFLV